MEISHYKTISEQFLESRKNHPEEPGRKVPIDTNQLPLGGIKVVDAAVMVFDIADSKNALDQLGNKKNIEWLGLALHCFFHCVDDYNGIVDKYTGDGAMVSFSNGTIEERCTYAKECAIKISQILNEIINPYFRTINYNIMNVRIGIDFGEIRIEKIGKRALSHLIIIGGAANYAKELEQKGKELSFDQYTTICLGYDLIHEIPKRSIVDSNGKELYHEIGTFQGKSEIDGKTPYPIYEYTGRSR